MRWLCLRFKAIDWPWWAFLHLCFTLWVGLFCLDLYVLPTRNTPDRFERFDFATETRYKNRSTYDVTVYQLVGERKQFAVDDPGFYPQMVRGTAIHFQETRLLGLDKSILVATGAGWTELVEKDYENRLLVVLFFCLWFIANALTIRSFLKAEPFARAQRYVVISAVLAFLLVQAL